MTEGHERRQFTRKVVDLAGEIQLGDAPRRPVHVTEMSLGGSFMETEHVPPFGAELTAFFRLPGHTVEFALRSVVRWTSRTGMGVQFGTCSARETHALSLYLAARPPVPIPAQPARPRPALGLRALTTTVPQPSAPVSQGARAAVAAPGPVRAAPSIPLAAPAGTARATPTRAVAPAPAALVPAAPAPPVAPLPAAPAPRVAPAPAAPAPRVAELEAALAAAHAERADLVSRHALALSERDGLVALQDDALLECHDLIARLEAELETRTAEVQRIARERAERDTALARLRAELAEQGQALAQKDAELAALRSHGAGSAPAAPPGDDLRRIRGIGPTFARALESMGIHHVAQVAAWSEDELAAAALRLKIPAARIRREGWVARAAELLQEGEPSSGPGRA